MSRSLLIIAHCDPSFAVDFSAAIGPAWTVKAFALNGLSSVYKALAAKVRNLQGLLLHLGLGHGADWDRVAIASWSAGYALAWPLLSELDAHIGLDSGYAPRDADGTASDVRLAPLVAFAKWAQRGKVALSFGFTDIATPYASTGDVAAELVRLAGPPGGSFVVQRWAHDAGALIRARLAQRSAERAKAAHVAHDPTDLRAEVAFWEREHVAALRIHGPAFVAAALARLGPIEPAAPTTPRTAGTPLPATRTLRRGDKGDDVRELQRLLAAWGKREGSSLVARTAVDGDFGTLTDFAVRTIQAWYSLTVDGIVGPRTWAALRGADGVADTDPAPAARRLGTTALEIARTQLGVRETGVNVVPYAPRTVRGGKWIGVQGQPWCSRFLVWCVWGAWDNGQDPNAVDSRTIEEWSPDGYAHGPLRLPPIGYRAAVAELVTDARATGTLHVTAAGIASGGKAAGDASYLPGVGDLAIFARDGGNPLLGGIGHVAFADVVYPNDLVLVLGGNQGDRVSHEMRPRSDVLAWIALA